MVRGTLRQRAIALAAAYALALQGLFVAFAPLAASPVTGILCSGQSVPSDADAPAAPAGHEPSCLSACAMLGAAALPLDIGASRVSPDAKSAAGPNLTAAALVAATRSSHTARAPPLA